MGISLSLGRRCRCFLAISRAEPEKKRTAGKRKRGPGVRWKGRP